MVVSACFVPNCSTGYRTDRKRCKKEGIKVKSLFRAPSDEETFEKWKRTIPRKDKDLNEGSFVCELHFLDEEIERYYITKMPDGSVHKIERGRPLLKVGSVPSLFPGLPKYFSKTMSKRKLPAERTSDSGRVNKKIKREEDASNEQTLTDDEAMTNDGIQTNEYQTQNEEIKASDISPIFDFKSLLQSFDKIKLPCKMWSAIQSSECLLYAKWGDDFLPEKRVIIKEDLSVNIFLKSSEMSVPEGKEIKSADDVSLLLKFVNEILLCAGIQPTALKESEENKCLLRLPDRESSHGRYSIFCEKCSRAKRTSDASLRRKRKEKSLIKHYSSGYFF